MSSNEPNPRSRAASAPLALPTPRRSGGAALAAVLAARRSVREFAAAPITLAELGQLLWAAQGVTGAGGGRAAPSAGATYPLELYAAAGSVEGLPAGLYRYLPAAHALLEVAAGDIRGEVAAAALAQSWIAEAAAIFVVAAVPGRTTGKYSHRGERFVQIEAGHAAENLCLQAVALGLGSTVVGAFDDQAVKALIGADQPGEPLCLLPVGRA